MQDVLVSMWGKGKIFLWVAPTPTAHVLSVTAHEQVTCGYSFSFSCLLLPCGYLPWTSISVCTKPNLWSANEGKAGACLFFLFLFLDCFSKFSPHFTLTGKSLFVYAALWPFSFSELNHLPTWYWALCWRHSAGSGQTTQVLRALWTLIIAYLCTKHLLIHYDLTASWGWLGSLSCLFMWTKGLDPIADGISMGLSLSFFSVQDVTLTERPSLNILCHCTSVTLLLYMYSPVTQLVVCFPSSK